MTIDEFEPEDALLEISRKLSNVSIYKLPTHGGTVEKDAVSINGDNYSRTDQLTLMPHSL